MIVGKQGYSLITSFVRLLNLKKSFPSASAVGNDTVNLFLIMSQSGKVVEEALAVVEPWVEATVEATVEAMFKVELMGMVELIDSVVDSVAWVEV